MWDNTQASVTGLEEPEQVAAMMVSDGTLPILGVRPQLGRLFSAQDDAPGAAETVILSHGYWQSRFAGDATVVGQILMEKSPLTWLDRYSGISWTRKSGTSSPLWTTTRSGR